MKGFYLKVKETSMKVTDTNSKGLIVSKTKRCAYFALTVEEAKEAIVELQKAVNHRESGGERVQLDARKY